MTSQKSMLPTLLRIGCMPALAESFSSSPLASSTRLTMARTAIAASHATSTRTVPRHQVGYVCRDLPDQNLERAGRKREVERVENADQRDENDQPEDAGSDSRLEVELLLGGLGDSTVQSRHPEQPTDAGTDDDCHDPADDENDNRTEDARQLRAQRGLERTTDCGEIHVASPKLECQKRSKTIRKTRAVSRLAKRNQANVRN